MKRRTALILALIMLLNAALFVPAHAFVKEGAAPLPACGFAGGGTEDEPFMIGSAEELERLSDAVAAGESFAGAYFALACDIDLAGVTHRPIGADEERPFAGTFDGNGFVILGLTVKTSEPYAALFGVSTGAIKNIVLKDARVSGGDYAAGIVGRGAAEYCEVYGSISGGRFVGGVVGEGAVFDSVSFASVSGDEKVGGVIGMGDAYRSEGRGAVSGRTQVSGVSGLGVCVDSESTAKVIETEPAEEPKAKQSVAAFMRWALTHIDPASIPTNANLFVAAENCGASPWEYLYGSVRVSTSQTSINNFYSNNYTKYMFRDQYDEIVADWSRSTYACDCQGLLDAWMTYEAGITTDINVQMNYSDWCTSKGEIESITRDWVIGEAVFSYSKKLGKMGHIGWICGFDEDGQPLVLEARGLAFGVVVTRLNDRAWTHRGLMTVKFNYDATMSKIAPYEAPVMASEDEEARAETVEPKAIWDGSTASSYAGGSGTEADPYVIANASQLAYLSYKVSNGTTYNGKYFVLTSDLWLNDTSDWTAWEFTNRPANEWVPIGNYATASDNHPFRGSFDGQGHTIYGMFFSENRKSFFGLFGYVGPNASGCIKNVKIASSFMEGVDNVGAIVGYLKDYGRVENCSNSGKVRGDHWVGGIVGYVSCESNPSVITSCKNSGSVRGATDAGGIVGRAHENCTVSWCTNSASFVKGYERAGGIIGNAGGGTLVNYCRNNGEVRGAYYIGGVAGVVTDSDVKKCYNGHDFSVGFRSGGVAGLVTNGSVQDCFNTGAVTCVEIVGGVVGTGSGASITRCYNIGRITAKRNRGGAIGKKLNSTTLTNVFMLENCCSGGNSNGTYLALAAFADESSYTGFDFDSVWKIDPATDYPFAEFKSLAYTSSNIPEYTPADPTPTPTATPTAEPTVTPEPTATPEPTVTPEPTETAEPTAEPTATPEPTPTPEPLDPNDPANFPVPERTLKRGDKGDDVKWLQAALTALGYPLDIDGKFGPLTEAAVMQFQEDHGLTPDGIVGPQTLAAIIAALEALYAQPEPPLLGDVDMDGEITTYDALALLRYVMGFMELTPEMLERADITGDGEIGSADALMILRLSMGLIT